MHAHRRSMIGVGVSILLAMVALAVALLMALPATAQAAPRHNRGLTIRSTPDPSSAGEGVLIYGQLTGRDNSDRRIWLFHRINPAARFTPVGVTRTNSSGFYEFVRADGVVRTNRNWFVLGPRNTHSRTIHELVSADVTLNAEAASATTAQLVSLSGGVFPWHAHQRVLLQQQTGTAGDGWRTVASGYTDAASAFSIQHRFRTAGSYTLRALLPDDPRNIRSPSASINLSVQQEQNPSFTIGGSAQSLVNGQSETITGTLYVANSTTTAAPNVMVTLYGRQGTGSFRALQSAVTNASGQYTFTAMPMHNTVYHVVTGHHERTANLYVGVEDVVSATLSSSTVAVGGRVNVTGTVTPDHSGHVLYLQEQNTAGEWVDMQAARLSPASTFTLAYTPGQSGTVNLRVQITGGPWNIGGASAPLALTVSGVAPVSSLPTAT